MDETTNSEVNSEAQVAEGATAGAETQAQAPTQATPESVSREAYSALQSRADKAEAEARRAREQAREAAEAAEKARQEAMLAGLKPEEREAAIRNFQLEARERQLREREQEQEETARALAISRLSMDYGLSDDDRARLDEITDVNEMRAVAAEMRSDRLARELEERGRAPQNQAPAAGTETPAAPRGMRAEVPGSGGGSSQSAYDRKKFERTGNVADSLKAKREAGLVEYERIPIRGR